MIFLDSNIPMYAAGKSSNKKEACIEFLRKIYLQKIKACSSAEILQEIIHRYRAIDKLKEGLLLYDYFRAMPILWFSITPENVDAAKEILLEHPRLSSRDSLHLAVMYQNNISKIATYDQGFLGIHKVSVYLPE